MRVFALKMELSNRLVWVEFVFIPSLNGLRNPRPKSNPFIEGVKQVNLYWFIF